MAMERFLSIVSDETDDPLLNYRQCPMPVLSDSYSFNPLIYSQDPPIPKVPDLCNFCKGTISQWPHASEQEPVVTKHHDTFTDLQASADQGCGLCAQFIAGAQEYEEWWDYLEADGSIPKNGVVALKLKARNFWPQSYMRLILLIHSAPEDFDSDGTASEAGDPSIRYRIRFEVDMLPAVQPGYDYDSITQSPSTLDALPICRNWLRFCLEKHKRCKRSVSVQIPTRLIEIVGPTCRIRLSQHLTGPVSYVTLSHCWGPSHTHSLLLTRNTLQRFQEEIPSEALPKTFRDAIYICRYLGFNYLWIDSLCILQDEEDDWKRESAMMSSVYGGGVLNIAATSAEDNSGGCFFQRKSTWRTQIQVQGKDSSTLYDCVPERLMFPFNVPLNRRAWAVQERYLSQRTLHFYEQQVFWECDGAGACETRPEGYMPELQDGSMFFAVKRPLTRERWKDIVFHYSRGRLTKCSDKLIAISGLAQLIQAETEDEYIAGMWRRNLEYQLCWSTLGIDSERIIPYQAPTWSWASIQGIIDLPDYHSSSNLGALCVEVLDVVVEHASENLFGPVRTAALYIGCQTLWHGTLKGEEETFNKFEMGSLFVDITPQFDCEEFGEENEPGISQGDRPTSDGESISLEDGLMSESHSSNEDRGKHQKLSRDIFLLPVRRPNESWGPRGLLLQATGTESGHYERLGSYFSEPDSFDELCRLADLQALPEHFTRERSSSSRKMQHVIVLV